MFEVVRSISGRLGAVFVVAIAGLVAVSGPAATATAVDRSVPRESVELVTTAIAYSEATSAIYATVPSISPISPNRLVRLDPISLDIEAELFVGSEPAVLALSPDGLHLYVGLAGAPDVVHVDLESFTADEPFVLQMDDEFLGVAYADDIDVSPDDWRTIIVSHRFTGTIPDSAGIAVYDDGIRRTDVVDRTVRSNRVEFSTDESEAYSYNGVTTGFELRRLSIDADGVEVIEEALPISGFGVDIEVIGDRIYATSGEIVDATTFDLIGTLVPSTGEPGFSAIVIDPAEQVAWGLSGNDPYLLETFDLDTLTPVGAITVSASDSDAGVADAVFLLIVDGVVYFNSANTIYGPESSVPVDPTGEFTALRPARLLDTRNAIGVQGSSALQAGQILPVQVTGRAGVPDEGVSAVVMNVTVVRPSSDGFISVYPQGDPPTVSNLNYRSGVTLANLVTVAVDSTGSVRLLHSDGESHVLFDIVGFYADGSGEPGARFRAVDPSRMFDTRTPVAPSGALGAERTLEVAVRGEHGLPVSDMTAVVMNVTVVRPQAAGFLTVHPGGPNVPVASNVNFTADDRAVPNLVTVGVDESGSVSFYNGGTGDVHVIADVIGFYTTDVAADDETGRLIPLSPTRLFDSRQEPTGRVASGEAVEFADASDGGLRSALVVNVAAVNPLEDGYLTVHPYPGDASSTSNVNFESGQTTANSAVARLGPGFAIHNPLASTHILIDLFAAFT